MHSWAEAEGHIELARVLFLVFLIIGDPLLELGRNILARRLCKALGKKSLVTICIEKVSISLDLEKVKSLLNTLSSLLQDLAVRFTECVLLRRKVLSVLH